MAKRAKDTSTPIETRSMLCEVRAADPASGKHTIVGRPIVFNSRTDIGWFDEIIAPGALDKTDLRDVRFLVNHNTDGIPMARSRNNNENSTMRLIPDKEGMNIEADLDTENNSEARALWSAVERGDISGMSFMYTVRGDKWDDLDSEHPTRTVTDIGAVFEVSAVTWPAYEATTIAARGADALESARAALESARAAARSLESDEKRKALELAKAKAIAKFI